MQKIKWRWELPGSPIPQGLICSYKLKNGRINSAMLIGANYWKISHLEKVIPYYEERLTNADN